MQLLAVKAVLAHHFIDEFLGLRIIGKIPRLHKDIMLRLQQETTRRRAGLLLRSFSFRFAATCGQQNNKRK
ncbi:hypothetical protein D3C75_792010 [compost metagenome]